MFRKGMLSLVVGVVAIGMLGCPKKAQEPMDIEPATVEPAEEVTPEPAPSTESDPQPDPLAGDIQAANEHAREQGLLGDVFFDFDRYELKADARERLAKNARFMADHPEFTFTVEGHCDERGTNEYNLTLGERRATSAMEYIVSLGVEASRLRTISYGEERPVCTESTESCWQRNRRAHFVITGRR